MLEIEHLHELVNFYASNVKDHLEATTKNILRSPPIFSILFSIHQKVPWRVESRKWAKYPSLAELSPGLGEVREVPMTGMIWAAGRANYQNFLPASHQLSFYRQNRIFQHCQHSLFVVDLTAKISQLRARISISLLAPRTCRLIVCFNNWKHSLWKLEYFLE